MHAFARHIAAAALVFGTSLAVLPSPAVAAPEPGLVQPVQYYRYYHRPYYGRRFYGPRYYGRGYYGGGPRFYGRRFYGGGPYRRGYGYRY